MYCGRYLPRILYPFLSQIDFQQFKHLHIIAFSTDAVSGHAPCRALSLQTGPLVPQLRPVGELSTLRYTLKSYSSL